MHLVDTKIETQAYQTQIWTFPTTRCTKIAYCQKEQVTKNEKYKKIFKNGKLTKRSK